MKKIVLTALCALISVSTFAQGTIKLSNSNSFRSGGAIQYAGGEAAGSETTVNLLHDGNVVATGNVQALGLFSLGTLTLDGIAPGDAEFTITASSEADGGPWTGSSAPFTVALGGAGSPPTLPGGLPADFSGVTMVAVPEPSTIALAVLGGAALLFRRRK